MPSHNHRDVACLLPVIFTCCQACLTGLGAEAADTKPGNPARQILAETGVCSGLIVHLGCGDGRLTVALGAGGCCLV